jgi:hypothetical protein
MNTTSAAALEASPLPSGASFLEVLAGTATQSAQPRANTGATSTQLAPSTDSSAANNGETADAKPGAGAENPVQVQVQVQGDNLQNLPVGARRKIAAGQKTARNRPR